MVLLWYIINNELLIVLNMDVMGLSASNISASLPLSNC